MIKKLFIFVLAGLMVITGARTALAEGTSTPVVGSDIVALQAQVAQLIEQIKMLKTAMGTQQSEIKELREELKLTRRLKQGSSGDDVKTLQELLATDPEIYPEGKVTGAFGPLTGKALRRFQEKHGLESVGEAGPRTLELLNRFMREGGAGKSGKIPKGRRASASGAGGPRTRRGAGRRHR